MELTTRQWELYNLLKSSPDHWFTQEEICEQIKTYSYSDDDRNHCVDIGTDQRAINENDTVDKIIITDKHCFKIANEEEYKHYRAKLVARIQSAVKQIEAWDTKYERNGQGKLFNNVLNDLKPQNEQFHETFMTEPEIATSIEEVALGEILIKASEDNIVVAINSDLKLAFIITEDFIFNEKEQTIKIGEFERNGITDLTTMFGLENFYKDYERKEL